MTNNQKVTNQTLEKKVKKEDNKQWVPVYGIYQLVKDKIQGKPSVMDNINSTKYNAYIIYQSLSVAIIGIYLYEKLI